MAFSVDKNATAKERKEVYRTLTVLAKSLENMRTTVDLRNESSATGRITEVDSKMNISLVDVAYVEEEGSYKYFAQLFIPSRMVRDIIIPDTVSISSLLKSALPRVGDKKKPKDENTRRTFKMKRALKNQQETLRLIKNQKEKNQRIAAETADLDKLTD